MACKNREIHGFWVHRRSWLRCPPVILGSFAFGGVPDVGATQAITRWRLLQLEETKGPPVVQVLKAIGRRNDRRKQIGTYIMCTAISLIPPTTVDTTICVWPSSRPSEFPRLRRAQAYLKEARDEADTLRLQVSLWTLLGVDWCDYTSNIRETWHKTWLDHSIDDKATWI